MKVDPYHPLVASKHHESCAALCTNNAGNHGQCGMKHECWCPDGSLTYQDFQAKHPDVTVAAEA